MFSICKNYIKVNDNLYEVKRSWHVEKIKNVELIKQWLKTDSVFRKDNTMYFCQIVEEAEIITE